MGECQVKKLHPSIVVKAESVRGCGWRKVGGLYLVSDKMSVACGRLPIELSVCPCCGEGIRPARGWTWVDADKLLSQVDPEEECPTEELCEVCPINAALTGTMGRSGLIWVGKKFYPSTHDFMKEAVNMGISRRITAVPNDFVVGETYVLLAHRHAILKNKPEMGEPPRWAPGIFGVFRPTAVEIIVDGSEADEEIDSLVKRGLTPVFIEKKQDTQINFV